MLDGQSLTEAQPGNCTFFGAKRPNEAAKIPVENFNRAQRPTSGIPGGGPLIPKRLKSWME